MSRFLLIAPSATADTAPALFEQLAAFSAMEMMDGVWSFYRYDTSAREMHEYFSRHAPQGLPLFITRVAEWAGSSLKCPPGELTKRRPHHVTRTVG
jgi:hypothetical protein